MTQERPSKIIDKKYSIIEQLGSGGFSHVYRVDGPKGQCALKILKRVEGLDLDEFKNEFSILKNLNHPNIARILDFGFDEDKSLYYFSSELIEGVPIRTAAKNASLEDITDLFVQVLRALEYLHAHRIHHFDIKSTNILIDSAKQQAKLIDFGLSGFDPGGKLIGTPAYMSPEIINTEHADGRSDIYSLGVVWYTCLTEINPFKGNATEKTLANQLSLIPPPPSEHNETVPQWLDQIIMRMLQKNPASRYPNALRVIRELNRLGKKNYALETRETLISYIPHEGAYIGRRDELDAIKKSLTTASTPSGKANSWLIVGDRGSGKTRFLTEIKYMSQLAGIRVSSAEAGGHDFLSWLETLSDHIAEGSGLHAFLLDGADTLLADERTWRRMTAAISKTHRLKPHASVILVMTADADMPKAYREELEGLVTHTIELKPFSEEELRDYLVELTGLETPPAPLVDGISRRSRGNPLFVTEIARSLISSGALFDEYGRWKPSLFEDVGIDFSRIIVPQNIEGLLDEKIAMLNAEEHRLVEALAVAGRSATATELGSWAQATDVFSALRSLVNKGLIERNGNGLYSFTNALLETLLYEQTDPAVRGTMHDRIADIEEADEGEREFYLYHRSRGSDFKRAYESAHELGEIYLGQGLGLKAEEHLRWIAAKIPDDDIERCIETALKLGEALLIGQRYDDAKKVFSDAIELLEQHAGDPAYAEKQIDVHMRLGGTYVKLQQFDRALDAFDKAKDYLITQKADPARRITIDNLRASVLRQEGKLDDALELFSQTRDEWRTLPPTEGRHVTNNDLGMTLISANRFNEARRVLEEDLVNAEATRDDLLIGRAHYNLAQLDIARNDGEAAVTHYKNCIEVCKRSHNNELLLRTYNGLGNAYRTLGDFDESLNYYDRGLALYEHIGDPVGGSILAINKGVLENERDMRDAALDDLIPAVDYLRSFPQKSASDLAALCRGLIEIGDILRKKKDFVTARLYLNQANSIATSEPLARGFRFWTLAATSEVAMDEHSVDDFARLLEQMEDVVSNKQQQTKLDELRQAQRELPKPAPRISEQSGISEKNAQAESRTYVKLVEINKLINSEANLSKILQAILAAAIEHAGAERGCILTTIRDTCKIFTSVKCESDEKRSLACDCAKRVQGGERILEAVPHPQPTSVLCMPIRSRQNILGALYMDKPFAPDAFDDADLHFLDALADQAGMVMAYASSLEVHEKHEEELEKQLEQISLRMDKYEQAMSISTGRSLEKRFGTPARSVAMMRVLDLLEKIADTDLSVMLYGESGTGKELIARTLHGQHPRRAKNNFVAVNCGAIPATLIESELFGYKAGAFTGAVRDKKGLFAEANKGTLFLDEIGDLDLHLQVKLLRVLQEREYTPVGDTKVVQCDVRIIAASNRDLVEMVKQGTFREDFYYRLCQIKIDVPPLRERREDIPLLVEKFLAETAPDRKLTIEPSLMREMIDYRWPGNVRELKNLIEVASALTKKDVIDRSILPETFGMPKPVIADTEVQREAPAPLVPPKEPQIAIDGSNIYNPRMTWEVYQQVIIAKAFEANNFKATRAAKDLGIAATTLYKKIKEWHLRDRRNKLYEDRFTYRHGLTLKDYTSRIFKAAYEYSHHRPYLAIANLKISQGFFYKVIKGRRR